MTTDALTITRAQPADLEVLLAFAERTFRDAYEHLNKPADFKLYCDEAFTPERFQSEMGNPHSAFWLAHIENLSAEASAKEGQLVAYIKLNFDRCPPELEGKKTVQVERIYVDAPFQGRRIGEKLLDFAYEQARAAGAEWLWLSVWQANPPAVRFYERCGYEICGTDLFQLGNDPQLDWVVRKKVTA